MQHMNRLQRFGLLSAGIGAGVAAIAMFTEALDVVQLVASSTLVAVGLAAYLYGVYTRER